MTATRMNLSLWLTFNLYTQKTFQIPKRLVILIQRFVLSGNHTSFTLARVSLIGHEIKLHQPSQDLIAGSQHIRQFTFAPSLIKRKRDLVPSPNSIWCIHSNTLDKKTTPNIHRLQQLRVYLSSNRVSRIGRSKTKTVFNQDSGWHWSRSDHFFLLWESITAFSPFCEHIASDCRPQSVICCCITRWKR